MMYFFTGLPVALAVWCAYVWATAPEYRRARRDRRYARRHRY